VIAQLTALPSVPWPDGNNYNTPHNVTGVTEYHHRAPGIAAA